MYTKKEYPGAVELSYAHEFIRIEAWGHNALRVRIGANANFPQGLGALEAAPLSGLGATSPSIHGSAHPGFGAGRACRE